MEVPLKTTLAAFSEKACLSEFVSDPKFCKNSFFQRSLNVISLDELPELLGLTLNCTYTAEEQQQATGLFGCRRERVKFSSHRLFLILLFTFPFFVPLLAVPVFCNQRCCIHPSVSSVPQTALMVCWIQNGLPLFPCGVTRRRDAGGDGQYSTLQQHLRFSENFFVSVIGTQIEMLQLIVKKNNQRKICGLNQVFVRMNVRMHVNGLGRRNTELLRWRDFSDTRANFVNSIFLLSTSPFTFVSFPVCFCFEFFVLFVFYGLSLGKTRVTTRFSDSVHHEGKCHGYCLYCMFRNIPCISHHL